MIRKVLAILLIGVVAGCSESSGTLASADVNANGVRDDVEAIIARNYASNTQRAAAMQTAKAMQKALTVDKTDGQALRAVARELSDGIHCLYSKFDGAEGSVHPAQVVDELKSITTNTKQRRMAYREFSKALDGVATALPEGDTCE